jgi:hypothetical protein
MAVRVIEVAAGSVAKERTYGVGDENRCAEVASFSSNLLTCVRAECSKRSRRRLNRVRCNNAHPARRCVATRGRALEHRLEPVRMDARCTLQIRELCTKQSRRWAIRTPSGGGHNREHGPHSLADLPVWPPQLSLDLPVGTTKAKPTHIHSISWLRPMLAVQDCLTPQAQKPRIVMTRIEMRSLPKVGRPNIGQSRLFTTFQPRSLPHPFSVVLRCSEWQIWSGVSMHMLASPVRGELIGHVCEYGNLRSSYRRQFDTGHRGGHVQLNRRTRRAHGLVYTRSSLRFEISICLPSIMQPTPDQQSAWTDPDAIRAWWATRSQSNFHRPWSAEQVASLRGPFVEYWPASEQGRKLRALFDKHQKDKTASVSIGAPDVVTAHLMADTGYGEFAAGKR